MCGKIIRLSMLLCATFMMAADADARTGPDVVADPGKHGFSEQGLANLRDSFNRMIADGEIAGMVGIVARNGNLVFHEALGMKDREKDVPLQTDTIFYIASLTKIITSVGAMILVDEGKLDLDAPVSDYLANFRDLKVLEKDGDDWKEVPPHRPMTARHLLTHTAGLCYGWFTQDRVDQLMHEKGVLKDNKTLGDMVGKLDRVPLKYHPGEVWEYSYASDVVGRLIEVISGQPLDEFFRDRIFKPLAMKDTGFIPRTGEWKRVSAFYNLKDGKAVRTKRASGLDEDDIEKPTYFSAGGGLCTTAHDYYVFMQMLLNGGKYNGVRLLEKKTVKEMTTNQIADARISDRLPLVGNRGFGLGLTIYDAPGGKGVCYSWGGATGTYAWFNIEKEMIGVFMIHISDQRYHFRFQDLVHKAFEG